jgi:multidrug efflux pump subunit AcrA (membrane-fusion protein)
MAFLDLRDLQAAETKAYYSYLAADAYAKKIEDEVKGHDADETFTQKYNRVSAQTARDTAYDAWLTAQRAVRNGKLISPMNGIVSAVTTTVTGDTVSVTDGITVVDRTSLYFSGEVDESDVDKITTSKSVKVSLDAFSEVTFGATISEIGFVSGLSSSGATVFPVKIKLLSDEVIKRLRLGMNGDADIVLEVKKSVLSLPVEAVADGKVTLPGKEAKQVNVKTGLEGDMLVEITDGLDEGDEVVIKQ